MKLTKYEILMVNLDSTKEEIKSNFKKLAKQTHPDLLKEDEKIATRKMQELIDAYQTLINDQKRKEYDLTLSIEEKNRIKEHYNQLHQNNFFTEEIKSKEIEEDWLLKYRKKTYILRTFYDNIIGYKYYQIDKNKVGFILKNFNTEEQIQCTDDCYKKYFKNSLFPKKHYLPEFYHYVPFQKEQEGIGSRLIWFENNIYIWRPKGEYRNIGPYENFIIENCFLYHKPTKKSFFYDSYTGIIVETTNFLHFQIQPDNYLEQKNPKLLSRKK